MEFEYAVRRGDRIIYRSVDPRVAGELMQPEDVMVRREVPSWETFEVVPIEAARCYEHGGLGYCSPYCPGTKL